MKLSIRMPVYNERTVAVSRSCAVQGGEEAAWSAPRRQGSFAHAHR
jgi:hypothetical protein